MGPLYERPLPFPPKQHPTTRTDYSRDRDGVGCRWRMPAVGFAKNPQPTRDHGTPPLWEGGRVKATAQRLEPPGGRAGGNEGAP